MTGRGDTQVPYRIQCYLSITKRNTSALIKLCLHKTENITISYLLSIFITFHRFFLIQNTNKRCFYTISLNSWTDWQAVRTVRTRMLLRQPMYYVLIEYVIIIINSIIVVVSKSIMKECFKLLVWRHGQTGKQYGLSTPACHYVGPCTTC